MAQLIKGTTYSTGDVVTASNLNNLVDGAQLAGGAISEQSSVASLSTSDLILVNQSGTLKKATIGNITGLTDTSQFIKKDGSVAMTGDLILSSATPSSQLAAAPVAYVQALAFGTAQLSGYVKTDGSVPMTSSLIFSSGTVVLNRNPIAQLEAVPLQYVSQQISGLATQTSLTAHTSRTDNPHVVTKAQVGLGNVDNTSDAAKPISTAAQAALDTKVSLTTAGNQNIAGGLTLGENLVLFAGSSSPATSLSAVPKSYADRSINKYDPGQLLDGTILCNGWVYSNKANVSDEPTSPLAFTTIRYHTSKPRTVAFLGFKTATYPNATIDTGNYLSVSGTRNASSSTLTINYAGLGSDYADPAKPFFLVNQYVGVVGQAGLTGRLYKILSHDINTRTFQIQTPETAAFSTGLQLSCVYKNPTNVDKTEAFNVKSVYIDLSCNKFYMNYMADTISGSMTNTTPTANNYSDSSTFRWCVNGNAIERTNLLQSVLMFLSNDAHIFNADVPSGFGATSMGSHFGLFYSNANGTDVNYIWQIYVEVTQR